MNKEGITVLDGALQHTLIRYVNYRGEESVRSIIPKKIWFGESPYHTVAQHFLRAWDDAKKSYRDFAMRDIKEWGI